MRALFSRHQESSFGIAIPDGAPTVTRLTQLMLEADEKHVALATDIRNGYGTTPRSEMLKQLFTHRSLSCFWRMMHWVYSVPSLLLLRDATGAVVAVLVSAEGVRQGDILAGLAFAIATLPVFVAIKENHPDVLVLAFVVDVIDHSHGGVTAR